ncbi:hypothetical protein F2Q70_00037810 [Brassica cretica]|uniref:EF-hand domain-containing protein n=1 Tax=Brassica cretica TaxID=69181 RepID=A0A8S9K1I6_BRACR|nr:hypothetical protein F2Q70_00037810 [Brassica cretica]
MVRSMRLSLLRAWTKPLGLSNGDLEKEMKELFKLCHIDCHGKISANELYVVMTGLGEKCTVESCVEMVRAVVADGDGYISFGEFKTLYSILRLKPSSL